MRPLQYFIMGKKIYINILFNFPLNCHKFQCCHCRHSHSLVISSIYGTSILNITLKVIPLFALRILTAHDFLRHYGALAARTHPEHNRFLMRLSSAEKRMAIYS